LFLIIFLSATPIKKSKEFIVKKDEVVRAVQNGSIEWQKHAFERMLERRITRDMVKHALLTGEIIEDYSEQKLYPGALVLGWIQEKPLHVVIAFDEHNGFCFIITTYEPDLEHFEEDYKTRRRYGDQ
jgi:hypothetical protein